ncbi:MAG: HtaA domain-containing protein [Chloroflexi bacterium]|nr:HtaA domain-containing protein [Chloroflexota bacterium]
MAFADLDPAAAPPVASGSGATWTKVPATLAEAGAPAFGGFNKAGQALDPMTFSIDVAAS